MIKKLRELAEKATPGPWVKDVDNWDEENAALSGWIKGVVEYEGCGSHYASWSGTNLDYVIAARPEVMLRLLAVVDAAKDNMTAAFGRIENQTDFLTSHGKLISAIRALDDNVGALDD